MPHPDHIRYQTLHNAVTSTTSIYRQILLDLSLRMSNVSAKMKDNALIDKEVKKLLDRANANIHTHRKVNGYKLNSDYLVRLSSHLHDINKAESKTPRTNHEFNLQDNSEGAALSMLEFPVRMNSLKSRLDTYLSIGLTVKEVDLHSSGEQWLSRARKLNKNILILAYIISLSDAIYRKNIDSVKIMGSVARGDLAHEPELERAWSDIAGKAYSGDDFEVWRRERSINIVEHFTGSEFNSIHYKLKDGTFESLLATLPLFRFDAVHGIKSGNPHALMGTYTNNANGIADLMGIEVNETGIMSDQVMKLGNVPKSILDAYDAIEMEIRYKNDR
jgi:hypothetical protein